MLDNQHIRLRAVEPEDLDRLYEWENNPEYWHAGEIRMLYSRFALKQYILSADKDIYESKQVRFMIDAKQSNKTVGTIDLFDFDVFNSRIAVGILIDRPYQGNDFASMSLELIKGYIFDYLKINQLYAFVADNNEASKCLFEKCNFQKTTLLKNWIRQNDEYVDVLVYQCFEK